MVLQSNDWNRVRAFYDWAGPIILAERADEWAIDPYAWDGAGMIHMTPIEAWLWSDLRDCNAIIYPQYPILNFFVDFANPVAKVAIECDGKEYHTDWRKDEARDEQLRDIGWTVYRFAGWECASETDEETHELGHAAQRLRRICNDHNIRRNRTQRQESVLAPLSHWMPQVVEMLQRGVGRQA